MSKEEILKFIYFDPTGYGSIKQTYEEAKKKDKTITMKDVKNFILPDDSNKSDWLAIPFLCTKNNRKDVLTYLEENNVQTRVCFSGNITKHPAYLQYKKEFPNSDNVMAKGFLLGCHHGMTLEDVDYVCNLLQNC